MAQLNLKYRKVPECDPKRICFLDYVEDDTLRNAAKSFDLEVLESEANNIAVLSPMQNTIYVLNKFENNPVLQSIVKVPNTWIFGPTFLKELSADRSLEIRSKPTYCSSMYGLCFYINCLNDKLLTERMMHLIQWMGGLFVKEPDFKVTHMITTTTQAKGYTYCSTFNVQIMTPQFVENCWANRQVVGHKASLNAEDEVYLPIFAGLYIHFEQFESEEYEPIKTLTDSNGGVVVSWNDPLCTHMVVHIAHAHQEPVRDIPPSASYVVSSDWFFSSLRHKYKANESPYRLLSTSSIMQSSWAKMDSTENGIPEEDTGKHEKQSDSISSTMTVRSPRKRNDTQDKENSILQRKDEKRKYAFEELCQSERNFINCINKLVKLKESVLEPARENGPILSQTQAKNIFGNLEEIERVHKGLSDQLDHILTNWENTAIIGQVFLEVENKMMDAYVAYAKNVQFMQQMFDQCEMANGRFRDLVQEIKGSQKENPKDIFIRPIQRLPSTVLTLSEIKKHTKESHPDKEFLAQAIQLIKWILNQMNDGRAEIEKKIRVFDVYNLIENCPPELVTSHREFITQFSMRETISRIDKVAHGPKLTMFLFNDVLEVTKQKHKEPKGQRPFNDELGSVKKTNKPCKHISKLSLSKVLFVMRFEEQEDFIGFCVQDLSEKSESTVNCFQYLDKKPKLDEIVLLIAKQLSQINGSEHPERYIAKYKSMESLEIKAMYEPKQAATLFMPPLLNKACQFIGNAKKNAPLRRSFSCGDISGSLAEL